MQADGWDPTSVTAGSGQRLPWKCKFGHRWESSVNNRAKGRGCPICAGKQVLAGFNDLKTTHPELAEEADGWDPTTVRPGSNKSFRWHCKSGQSSGSGYGTWVVGMRLDKALRALGWSRLQAAEYSGCRNKTLAGIWNLDNWIVVGQTSSMLYACKP